MSRDHDVKLISKIRRLKDMKSPEMSRNYTDTAATIKSHLTLILIIVTKKG